MLITERQKLILDRVIEEYIDSAVPVSSQLIEKKHKLGVCPATIRNDMCRLTELGFLHQPHTSAGRVPTDKGYRLFVNEILKDEIGDFEDLFGFAKILERERKDIFRFASHISKFLAGASSTLVTIHISDRDFFWKDGWEEVIREPEFDRKEFLEGFADLLKSFEEKARDVKLNSEIRIYIGKENPYTNSKEFTVISRKCHFPKKEKGFVSLLGPKRMPYERNIGLLNSVVRILDDF